MATRDTEMTAAIPFLKQLTLSDREMIQKFGFMPLRDIRAQLYENTIYETFDYMITRYKRNSISYYSGYEIIFEF